MRFIFRKDLNPVTKGFTLVELLIVVSILGILAAFTMSIINTRTQRSGAEDAVRQATVQKLAQGLEGFYAAEGFYPATTANGDPLGATGANRLTLLNYIGVWPTQTTEFPGTYYYNPITEISATEGAITFDCVSIGMATTPGRFIKYVSRWHAGFTGGLPACGGKVLKNCTRQCSDGAYGNDFLTCTQNDETPC